MTRGRTITYASALDDEFNNEFDDELDPEHSDVTLSPPASTVQNKSSGPATDERSQNPSNSDVSDGEASAMTLDTDTGSIDSEQGEPEPVVTRKEVRVPVCLPLACIPCRY
jgi:hypothetical protein